MQNLWMLTNTNILQGNKKKAHEINDTNEIWMRSKMEAIDRKTKITCLFDLVVQRKKIKFFKQ